MTLTPETAREIVEEAGRRDIYKGALPGTTDEFIETAQMLIELARQALEQGTDNEAVRRILELGGEVNGGPTTTGDVDGTGPVAGSEGPPFTFKTGFRRTAEEIVAREQLPIPPALSGEPPEMPRDLTARDDRTIRRLQGEWNAWHARTQYLIGAEQSDLEGAKQLLERAESRAMQSVPREDDQGRALRMDEIKALAAAEPSVVDWQDRLTQHKATLAQLTHLEKVYAGHIMRLAYDWKARADSRGWAGGE